LEYTTLGSSGLKVSRICLGTMTYGSNKWRKWVLEEDEARPFIRRALELGINFIDTANMYSMGLSEEILGRALKDFGPPREQLVIATKVFMPMGDDPNQKGLSRKHIVHAIDASLRRLQLDYVDLYLIHRYDPGTRIEETLRALDDLVRAGKVLYTGASSMSAWQFAKMLYVADQLGVERFSCMQNHYNVIYREEEREMMPLCLEEGIAVTPYSPLARGFVAGNRRPVDFGDTRRAKVDEYSKGLFFQPADFAVVEQVTKVAAELEVSNARVALAWLLQQPGVTSTIVGATKLAQLEDAVEAVGLKLEPGQLEALASEYQPHPILVGRRG
jgi:aryl-alcohol dehydrogenase-like predicted oxidoreductase